MEKLLKDYEDKLQDVLNIIEGTTNTGSHNDIEKHARLNTKASEYRTFIEKLQITIKNQEELNKKFDDELATLVGLYYGYKKTSDSEIQEYLEKIKIVKKEIHAGGKITKYYSLNAKAIKKIKAKPRNVSLTFDATTVIQKAVSGLEEFKRIPYLCKSTSRFFLKPDIGEIFDAIDWRDLITNEFDAICFDNGYETLPNTEGEHHLMYATLLINPKARAEKEKQRAVTELNEL